MEYNELKIGGIKCGHVQGIAIDEKKEYMYFLIRIMSDRHSKKNRRRV